MKKYLQLTMNSKSCHTIVCLKVTLISYLIVRKLT